MYNKQNLTQITLKYNSSFIVLKIEPYKQIVIIREKCYDLFFPISNNIQLLYQNKDLIENYVTPIGDFFKNKSKIVIVVKELNERKKDHSDLIDNYPKKRIVIKDYNNSFILPEISNSNNNSFLKHYNLNFKNRNLNVNHLRNSSVDNLRIFNKNNNDFSIDLIEEKCNECFNNLVSYLCRKCGNFICKNCNQTSHKEHKTIFIKLEDLNESLKIYHSSIISDIKNKNKTNINYSSIKQEIFRNLEKIEFIYLNYFSKLNYNNCDENEFKIISSDMDTFFSNNRINYNPKLTFKEIKDYFLKLHQNDKTFNNLFKDFNFNKINYNDYSIILDDMLKTIENTIDNSLIFHSKNEYLNDNEINIHNVNQTIINKSNTFNNLSIYQNYSFDYYNKKNISDDRKKLIKIVEEQKEIPENNNVIDDNIIKKKKLIIDQKIEKKMLKSDKITTNEKDKINENIKIIKSDKITTNDKEKINENIKLIKSDKILINDKEKINENIKLIKSDKITTNEKETNKVIIDEKKEREKIINYQIIVNDENKINDKIIVNENIKTNENDKKLKNNNIINEEENNKIDQDKIIKQNNLKF